MIELSNTKCREPLRSYQHSWGKSEKVDFASLPARNCRVDDPHYHGPAPTSSFATDLLEKASHKAHKGKWRSAPLVPKDCSVDPSVFQMGHSFADDASLGLIRQMAQVGRVEGFRVQASCHPGEIQDLREELGPLARQLDILPNLGSFDVWTEDHGEFSVLGERVVPARLGNAPVLDWIYEDRIRRLYSDKEAAEYKKLGYLDESRWPKACFSVQGAVNENCTQQDFVASDPVTMDHKVMALSYVEGGNMLPGLRPDGTPYAVVGRDSVAISRRHLSEKHGVPVSEAETLKTIALDYGVPVEQLFPMEQPGEFHIDMGVSLAGPGQVLVNDSMEVYRSQSVWLDKFLKKNGTPAGVRKQELENLRLEAERQAEFEEMSIADLKKAGLEVHRVAGCFPPTPANPAMNFLNLRQGLNREGDAFAVMLGGDSGVEEYIADQFLNKLPLPYQRVHFLDSALTEKTLELSGGIKCRTKGRVDLEEL